MDRTFAFIKPDGVQRGLIGKVIERFENRGMKILAMKLINITPEQAKEHYKEHEGKDFYDPLLNYIMSGPVVAMVIEGRDCVKQIRKLAGDTDPKDAEPGTIRYDFAQLISRNIIHAADSDSSAEREIAIYFKPNEILDYTLDTHHWVFGD
jgi:nucleoside-diphosphate kinase